MDRDDPATPSATVAQVLGRSEGNYMLTTLPAWFATNLVANKIRCRLEDHQLTKVSICQKIRAASAWFWKKALAIRGRPLMIWGGGGGTFRREFFFSRFPLGLPPDH